MFHEPIFYQLNYMWIILEQVKFLCRECTFVQFYMCMRIFYNNMHNSNNITMAHSVSWTKLVLLTEDCIEITEILS